ncbi:MAG: methyltransferase domain-containing protein [Pseudomonadales bacterium]|nr:methyltransferase domain-containing protein [Pseudomonadales bacterium]
MQTVDFKHFKLKKGDRVLDLGCGEGRHVISAYLEEDIEAIGVDLCVDDLLITQEKAKPFIDKDNKDKYFALACTNALALPFADNSFDKVVCSEVLEHIPDYEGALKEIERILKPGGIFCASVPRFWPEWVCWHYSDDYHENEGGHVRIFLETQLRRKIENNGFKFYHRHWAHALHSPYWMMQCMDWKNREDNRAIKAYHKFLVWDMMEKPWITKAAEKALNPGLGKSVVMYFEKAAA